MVIILILLATAMTNNMAIGVFDVVNVPAKGRENFNSFLIQVFVNISVGMLQTLTNIIMLGKI